MNHKNLIKFSAGVLLAVGMLLGGSTPARAGTITQSFSYFGPIPTLVDTPWTYDFNLHRINLIGGSLTSVTLKATDALSGDIGVTNTGGSSLTVWDVGSSMRLFLTDNSSPSSLLSTNFGPSPLGHPVDNVAIKNSSTFVLDTGGHTNMSLSSSQVKNYTFTTADGLGEFAG